MTNGMYIIQNKNYSYLFTRITSKIKKKQFLNY